MASPSLRSARDRLGRLAQSLRTPPLPHQCLQEGQHRNSASHANRTEILTRRPTNAPPYPLPTEFPFPKSRETTLIDTYPASPLDPGMGGPSGQGGRSPVVDKTHVLSANPVRWHESTPDRRNTQQPTRNPSGFGCWLCRNFGERSKCKVFRHWPEKSRSRVAVFCG